MRGLSRVVLLTAVVLFSGGVTLALAGKSPSVSPGLLSQPVPGVKSGQTKSYHYQAVTRASVKKTGLVRAGGLAWQCRGKRCTITGPWPNPTVNACRALARQVGFIRSYGNKDRNLSKARLKRCNAGVVAKSASTIRSPALSSPKLVARSVQPSVPPAKVARSAKLLPPAFNAAAVVKHKKGFAVVKTTRKPVSALAGPPRTTTQSVKSKGGFSLTKPPSDNIPSAGKKQPLERKISEKLFALEKKKESEVDRKTGEMQSLSSGSGRAGTTPPHRGGFAPVSPHTAGGVTVTAGRGGGGFALAGIAGQVHVSNALSREQLARISGVQDIWANYKRAVEEKRRQDEARARERIEREAIAARGFVDCDDTDANINPNRDEVCDHKDNNCDGHVDEGVTIRVYADVDGDGHGDPAQELDTCQVDINNAPRDLGKFLVPLNNDCDDHDPDHWHDCATVETGR